MKGRPVTDPLHVPVLDQEAVKGASPQVSVLANTIGYAFAERGVEFTADDAIAAAQRVVDQELAR
jgi:hypothetical protein